MKCKIYKPDKRWIVTEMFKLMSICIVIGYVFFGKISAAFFTVPIGVLIGKNDLDNMIRNKKKIMSKEFKDMLVSLSGNLNAGYSLEKSFYKTFRDLSNNGIAYRYIIKELKNIIHGLECNQRIEELISVLAKKSDIDDIKLFSQMISATKAYGGNLNAVIRQTVINLNEKYMVGDEIETMIAAKKAEGKIMIVMPLVIILYLSLTNKGYMDVMYETSFGKAVMALSLVIIAIAGAVINKIVKIEV